jgi:hypothetical protein
VLREKRTSKQRNDFFNFVGWGDKDKRPIPLFEEAMRERPETRFIVLLNDSRDGQRTLLLF